MDALGGNRTPISRTGILRAIRCTTRACNGPTFSDGPVLIIFQNDHECNTL